MGWTTNYVMPVTLNERLENWLATGGWRLGEIAISPSGPGWALMHFHDCDQEQELSRYDTPEAAREISRYDAEGKFRPLKSAPSLRRGWILHLPDLATLRLALDFFYPAAVANLVRWLEGEVQVPSLRETLERQTGIYRITAQITQEEAAALVQRTCSSEGKCLRRIAWALAPGCSIPLLPAEKTHLHAPSQEWPLVCLGACPLLIGAARRVVRARSGKGSSTGGDD